MTLHAAASTPFAAARTRAAICALAARRRRPSLLLPLPRETCGGPRFHRDHSAGSRRPRWGGYVQTLQSEIGRSLELSLQLLDEALLRPAVEVGGGVSRRLKQRRGLAEQVEREDHGYDSCEICGFSLRGRVRSRTQARGDICRRSGLGPSTHRNGHSYRLIQ